MCEQDSDLENVLESARIEGEPDGARMDAVRRQMMNIAHGTGKYRLHHRAAWIGGCLVVGLTTVGLAGTQAGRDWVRSLFTPVEDSHVTTWEAPDGTVWSQSRYSEAYRPEEEEAVAREFGEIFEIQQAGGGRLLGLLEVPGMFGEPIHTIYNVEYTLSNGQQTSVGGSLSPKQRENMRVDEIMGLRDAGAGDIVAQCEFPIGLDSYTLRFTLSDGETVDLQTYYPPSTRAERETIFGETRALKARLEFTVLNASLLVENPDYGVWGVLQYTLADGRTVGITEGIPNEVISPDGTLVVVPETGERVIIEHAASPSH